jgi:hypothetical protein
VSVPEETRTRLRSRLWEIADQVGWINLSTTEKSKHYEDWTKSREIGGLLTRFIDGGQVRLYIKDTLLKGYALQRSANASRPLRVCGIESSVETVETYLKPHGRRLADGRIVCWGRADDWKSVLMALHERAFVCKGTRPFAAVLFSADGRFRESDLRSMVKAAADRLAIEKLIWLDT